MGSFAGWQGEFQGFFLGLAANNSKAYFEAHRRQYEHDVKAPLLALLADLEPEFGPARVSRPNRDIRFSPDKSPYKTNIYADARSGGYVALSADGLMAAGGRYVLDGAQLQRFRLAVDAARSGAKLAAIVAGLEQRGYLIGGEELKRVPPPYPADHPRGRLLRHKRLIYSKRWEVGPWIATPEAGERVAQVWRDGRDLNAWLANHLDG
ncbi:MAG: DUF2461 domain-containing protein [Candidatus Dormibacteria bacterium]